jgi:hypothetical protein
MATARVVEYKLHEIQVVACRKPRENYFSATYEIRALHGTARFQHGFIAGALLTVHDAESTALKVAMRWVDDRGQDGGNGEAFT